MYKNLTSIFWAFVICLLFNNIAFSEEQVNQKNLGKDASVMHLKKRAELLVVIINDNARIANYPGYGYTVNTTPFTKNNPNLLFFSNMTACATSSEEAMSCMLSLYSRDEHDLKKAHDASYLPDVLKYAGIGVYWIDNSESGCSGVCEGVNVVHIKPTDSSSLCEEKGCYNEILLSRLIPTIENIKEDHKVVFLHLRSDMVPEEFKYFDRDCDEEGSDACKQQMLIEEYNNSIYYADNILARTIDVLSSYSDIYDAGVIFTSLHGTSLGEYGLIGSNTHYAVAPDYQKNIPFITWFSDEFFKDKGLDMDCLLKKTPKEEITHDNIFHSVLGILDIKTSIYKANYDIFKSCRKE